MLDENLTNGQADQHTECNLLNMEMRSNLEETSLNPTAFYETIHDFVLPVPCDLFGQINEMKSINTTTCDTNLPHPLALDTGTIYPMHILSA